MSIPPIVNSREAFYKALAEQAAEQPPPPEVVYPKTDTSSRDYGVGDNIRYSADDRGLDMYIYTKKTMADAVKKVQLEDGKIYMFSKLRMGTWFLRQIMSSKYEGKPASLQWRLCNFETESREDYSLMSDTTYLPEGSTVYYHGKIKVFGRDTEHVSRLDTFHALLNKAKILSTPYANYWQTGGFVGISFPEEAYERKVYKGMLVPCNDKVEELALSWCFPDDPIDYYVPPTKTDVEEKTE